jgi:hypothetical protein
MKDFFLQKIKVGEQRGAVLVLMAVLLIVLIGVAALAIDLGHLFVVKNELQNAADAGALAGAQALYADPDPKIAGTIVKTGANAIARETAILNLSEKLAVEVNLASDVQRGHYNMNTKVFSPNDSTTVPTLEGKTADDLYADPDFINAVRLVAHREDTPASSFFARIFGYQNFGLSADAVAIIGFTGTLAPGELDQPIAICAHAIMEVVNGEDVFSCNIGRMIDSSNDLSKSNTAGWTSFKQDDSTCSGTNTSELRPLICGDGNPNSVNLGGELSTTGGTNQDVFNDLRKCWETNSNDGTIPWKITLPVVDCNKKNVGNCPELISAVVLNMLWMTEGGTAKPADSPTQMATPDQEEPSLAWDWASPPASCSIFQNNISGKTSDALTAFGATTEYKDFGDSDRWKGESTYTEGMARWDCFTYHFKLKNADDKPAPFEKKSMYFLPDCEKHTPKGNTGGSNFGILAKYPALVPFVLAQ